MTCEKAERLACPYLGTSAKQRQSKGNSIIPGCSVESTTFLACHISGVIDLTWPCLYVETRRFAFSRPDAETKRVLGENH